MEKEGPKAPTGWLSAAACDVLSTPAGWKEEEEAGPWKAGGGRDGLADCVPVSWRGVGGKRLIKGKAWPSLQ